MERLAGDVAGLVAGQIDHGGGDLVGRAEALRRDAPRVIAAVCFSLSASVIAVAMKPGATQLTVMPREATSWASALVMPIMPALEAA